MVIVVFSTKLLHVVGSKVFDQVAHVRVDVPVDSFQIPRVPNSGLQDLVRLQRSYLLLRWLWFVCSLLGRGELLLLGVPLLGFYLDAQSPVLCSAAWQRFNWSNFGNLEFLC